MKFIPSQNLFQFTGLLLLAGALSLKATNDTWTGGAGDNNWNTGLNWSGGSSGVNTPPATGDTPVFGAQGAGTLTLNNDIAGGSFLGLTFNANAPAFTLNGNSITTTGGLLDNSLNLETIGNMPIAFSASHSVNVIAGGSLTINSVISGTGSYVLTKNGGGKLNLTGEAAGANTYGPTTINAGTLLLDFSQDGSTPTANIVPNAALTLSGGTLIVNGASGTANSQSFTGTTFPAAATAVPGQNFIAATNGTSGGTATINLGALSVGLGSSIVFNGPATTNATAPVAATGIITTTTQGQGPTTAGIDGILANGANNNDYATVGLYDWASTDLAAAGGAGTSPYTIIGGSQVTGFYVVPGNNAGLNAGNNDIATQQTPAIGGTSNIRLSSNGACDSVRFNSGHAPYITIKSGDVLQNGGVLVTPNMGIINCGMDEIARLNSAEGVQIVQNNTLGVFCSSINGDQLVATGNAGDWVVISGPGAVFLNPITGTHIAFNYLNASSAVTASSSTYYDSAKANSGVQGPFFINGGVTVINSGSALGNGTASTSPGGLSTVNLNGGTLMGAINNFSLVNSSSANHAVFLGGNGGGLAAQSGTTLTVPGVIAGASGTGPLTIGIAASSANGNTAGLVPGTGTIGGTTTANPAFMATGTVALTGANTYYGGTVLQTGTAEINGINNFGGANYGGLTFNGGTLQYAGSASGAGSLDLTSIGTAGITLAAGGGTIDVNGNAVTYAGSIGNNGSGALTVEDTLDSGALTLSGANTYTGGTTVNSGAKLLVNGSTSSGTVTVNGTLGGTGTIGGNVDFVSGSALLTAGSPLTVSGSVTLNNTTVTTTTALTSSGSPYTLLDAGSITGGSSVNAAPGAGSVAGGYIGTVSISGNSVILTVVSAGVVGTWTDGNASGNWSDAGNWSGGVPELAGSTAIFGNVVSPVTLDADESVGALTFNQASSYTISGGNTLTLDNKGAGAAVSVTAGAANAIQTAVALNDNATVTASSGASLTFAGAIVNSSGAETLTFNGEGTNVLSAANSYGTSGSTGTTLSGGTLQVGNNDALGAGNLSVSGSSTIQAGVASLNLGNNIGIGSLVTATMDNNGNDVTLGGDISGNGSLTKIGNHTLILGGNNTYAGNTTVNGGVLSIASAANVADTPSIILNGGDLLANGTIVTANNIGIGANTTTAYIDASGTLTLNGVIATAGSSANNLTVNSLGGTGTVVLGGANTFSGATVISAGTLQLANALALQNSALNYSSGTIDFGSLTAATLGGLSGSQDLSLLNDSSAAVTLTVGGNNASTAFSGNLSGSGSLGKIGAGTFTLGNVNYTGNTVVYNGGLTITGGTLSSHLDLSAQQGTVNAVISGGSVISPSGLYLTSPTGGSGTIYGSAATLTVTNGAQVTANADANGRALSYGAASSASSGERPGGNGFLTVGTPGDTTTVVTANGALDMFASSGGSTVGTFTVNLNGGTLAVKNIQETTYQAAKQTAVFSFNGGILKALSSDTTVNFIANTAAPELTTVVNSGGAIIDANGFDITIATALTHGTGTPDGGLIKLGAGSLTLSGANTYTGPTAVSNGTLVVNGDDSAANGAVTVTNATLSGAGTIGGETTLQPDAILAAGTNGVGTLTFSDALTLDAASTNNFVVTTVGGASNKVAVAGALTPNGSVIRITSGTALWPGTNTLFTYSGGISGTFTATPVFDVAPVHPASIVDTGTGINLVVSNLPPVVANIVTNNVISGLTWKMAIADLSTAAGWSDPDGDTVTLSGVASLSDKGTSVSSDGKSIFYGGPVTAEDHFTYTVTDPYGATAVGIVYLEAVAGAGPSISGPAVDGNGHPTFSGAGIPGYTYGVESAASLSGPWINAGTVTVGSTGAWSFTDASQNNPATIFYRLYYPYSAGSPPQ